MTAKNTPKTNSLLAILYVLQIPSTVYDPTLSAGAVDVHPRVYRERFASGTDYDDILTFLPYLVVLPAVTALSAADG
jgi:hypothetical protein